MGGSFLCFRLEGIFLLRGFYCESGHIKLLINSGKSLIKLKAADKNYEVADKPQKAADKQWEAADKSQKAADKSISDAT